MLGFLIIEREIGIAEVKHLPEAFIQMNSTPSLAAASRFIIPLCDDTSIPLTGNCSGSTYGGSVTYCLHAHHIAMTNSEVTTIKHTDTNISLRGRIMQIY